MKQLFLAGALLISMFFAAVSTSQAQTTEDMKRTINSIKKNNRYLYAEATSATPEEARKLAEEMLLRNVKEWAANQKKFRKTENIIVKDTKDALESLELPRGNMFRSFVYVSKSNVEGVDNTVVVSNDGVATDDTKDAKGKSGVSFLKQFPAVVQRIAVCQDFTALDETMKREKQAGEVTHYDFYENIADVTPYYAVVYDRQYKIVAVLSPGTERYNVLTGKPDAITSYSGCGAVCFTIPSVTIPTGSKH